MCKSGDSEEHTVRLATTMFDKLKVPHPREDVGKPFRFLACWEIIRDLPKFLATFCESSPLSSAVESNKTVGGEECEDGPRAASKAARPVRRRNAKEEAAVQSIRAKRLKLAEEAVRLQERHVLELKKRAEILLFMNGPNGSNSLMAKEYFAL